MERYCGLTDKMHGYVGAIMFFSFIVGTSVVFISISYWVGIPLIGLSLVGDMLFVWTLCDDISSNRIEAYKYLFSETHVFKIRDFIDIDELNAILALCILCIVSGCLVVLLIWSCFTLDSILLVFSILEGVVLYLIPKYHREMSLLIHRNDLKEFPCVRRQKLIYSSKETLRKTNK